MDPSGIIEPTISHGRWGWLCSAYVPVYDRYGSVVCHVGCDVSMEDIMAQRFRFFVTAIIGALVITVFVQLVVMLLVTKFVVKPLRSITQEMKKFRPTENVSYKDAGVVQLEIHSNDEIEDIYLLKGLWGSQRSRMRSCQ